jgi:ketosteroid isomerase-like protein
MNDREVIARRRAEFLTAFNREDVETMAEITADDIVAMVPGRPQLSGKAALRAFWQEGFAAAESRFSVTPLETDIAGDIAVDLFRWTMDSAPRAGGEPIHDEGKNLWVWRRQKDSGWKLARAIWNSDLPQGGVWSGAATSTSSLTAQDREILRDLIERQWTEAWLARDCEKLLAMCAADIAYMPADHPSLRGHAELRAWVEQFPKTLRFTQPLDQLEGDANRTVARVAFKAAIEVEGKPVDVAGKVLCSFRKELSGKWLVTSVCWNFDRPMTAAS